MKNIKSFLSENFQFLEVKFSIYMYLNRHVYIMQVYSNKQIKYNMYLSTLSIYFLHFKVGMKLGSCKKWGKGNGGSRAFYTSLQSGCCLHSMPPHELDLVYFI